MSFRPQGGIPRFLTKQFYELIRGNEVAKSKILRSTMLRSELRALNKKEGPSQKPVQEVTLRLRRELSRTPVEM